MFDDINTNPSGQLPGNLPVAEPDDIFAATEAPDINQSSAVGAGKLQPKTNLPPMSEPTLGELSEPKVQTMPDELARLNKMKNPTFAKNIMIAVIVLVGVGILAGGSWLVYTMFVKPSDDTGEFVLPENIDQMIEEKTTTTTNPSEENTVQNNIPNAQVDDSILFGEQTDSDADNLTDNREKELGTNPNSWDSDSDEVSDGDEVLVWKSNPLNRDTDGDGYTDGAEITNGFNPVGPGKIFDIPQQQ